MNGKLWTAIKTRGEDIKSYTPVPGDRMQEGSNGRRQFNQNHVFFFQRSGDGADRTTMFNNVLRARVQECTKARKMWDLIRSQSKEIHINTVKCKCEESKGMHIV